MFLFTIKITFFLKKSIFKVLSQPQTKPKNGLNDFKFAHVGTHNNNLKNYLFDITDLGDCLK